MLRPARSNLARSNTAACDNPDLNVKRRHITGWLFILMAGLPFQFSTADTAAPQQTLDAIELPDLTGDRLSLDHWKGKTILLNFWASWCAPCQYEIPHLINYQNLYAEKNFQVVSIGLDEKRKLNNVKRSLGINYPVLVTTQQAGAALLAKLGNNQQIVPYTLIINAEQEIVYTHRGEFDDDAFEMHVRPLL